MTEKFVTHKISLNTETRLRARRILVGSRVDAECSSGERTASGCFITSVVTFQFSHRCAVTAHQLPEGHVPSELTAVGLVGRSAPWNYVYCLHQTYCSAFTTPFSYSVVTEVGKQTGMQLGYCRVRLNPPYSVDGSATCARSLIVDAYR